MKLRIIFLFFLVTLFCVQAQQKQGGICFRVDDNQNSKWEEVATIFKKYNLPFTFAANLGILQKESIPIIQNLQALGYEFQDHTPNHFTHYFTVEETTKYVGKAGVDHVVKSKICLKIKSIDLSKIFKFDSLADIRGNLLISKSPGGFKNFNDSYIGPYLLSTSRLCGYSTFSNTNSLDTDTLQLLDFWFEPIDLGNLENVQFKIIQQNDVIMEDDAVTLLVERTLELSGKFGIDRSYVWIQPGGPFPQLNPDVVTRVMGQKFNYSSAGTQYKTSFKCFNESSQNTYMRYGMNWGDFYDDIKDLQSNKTIIADRLAKHYVSIGHSHFTNLLGGWQGYLDRVDSLLQWCKQKNIPVLTYIQIAKLLYDDVQDPYTNVFPHLNIDLDENGNPDGYYNQSSYTDGKLDRNDGVAESGFYSYSLSKKGSICYISRLAGLEKGENAFEIYTKGEFGDSVEVSFTFTEKSNIPIKFKFPAVTSVWKKYTLDESTNGNKKLIIPEDVSHCDVRISVSNYLSGNLKISGMKLRKALDFPLKIISKPDSIASIKSYYSYQVRVANWYQDPLTFELISGPNWLSISKDGLVSGRIPNDAQSIDFEILVYDQHSNSTVQKVRLAITDRKNLKIEPLPQASLIAGAKIDHCVNVEKNYDDTLSFALENSPQWLTINRNGHLSGFAEADSGFFNASIKVANQLGDSTISDFVISVKRVLDDFEYTDSPINHSWSVQGNGNVTIDYDDELNSKIMVISSPFFDGFVAERRGEWKRNSFECKIKSSETFKVNVLVIDSIGTSYTLVYTPDFGATTASGNTVYYHIGSQFRQGEWQLLNRNLREDLENSKGKKSDVIIKSIAFKGNMKIDDLIVRGLRIIGDSQLTSIIPKSFSLGQNYPNPFNNETTFEYSIPISSMITIEIFNVLGQKISSSSPQMHRPGRYVFRYAPNTASGVYFYKLKAQPVGGGHSEFISVKKLLLIK